MDSTAVHRLLDQQNSDNVDHRRGNCLPDRSNRHSRNSIYTPTVVKTGRPRTDISDAWCRSDVHPGISSPSRRSTTEDEVRSPQSQSPSRLCSNYDFTSAAAPGLNLSHDRLSEVTGCKLPATKDPQALKNLLVLEGPTRCQ